MVCLGVGAFQPRGGFGACSRGGVSSPLFPFSFSSSLPFCYFSFLAIKYFYS